MGRPLRQARGQLPREDPPRQAQPSTRYNLPGSEDREGTVPGPQPEQERQELLRHVQRHVSVQERAVSALGQSLRGVQAINYPLSRRVERAMWKSLPSFCSSFMLLFILNRKRAENRTVFRMDANLRFPPLFLSGGNGGGGGALSLGLQGGG